MLPKSTQISTANGRDEWVDSPEVRALIESQFPALAGRLETGSSRREFLKLMSASLGLAGLTGCRWPKETIVPYAERPEGRMPGVPVQYATAMELCGVATGLLVSSYDGRPIKIEGNPSHPYSRGKTNAWHQASVLELYDPDRSPHPIEREGPPQAMEQIARTWSDFSSFAAAHFRSLRASQGAGLAVLSESSSSPSIAAMKARLGRRMPQAAWYEYEPISRDQELAGAQLIFQRPVRTHWHLDKATRIVSLDSDFLMTHPAAVKYAGDFSAGRRGDDQALSRLYVFERNYSVTGCMADQRIAVRSALIPAIARRLFFEVSQLLGEAQTALGSARPPELPELAGTIQTLARDLAEHRGESLIVAGHEQPAEVHAVTHALNVVLRNLNSTVTFTDEPDADRPPHAEAIASLVKQISAGEVDTLVILGGNPVHDVPPSLKFDEALGEVAHSIHLSLYEDETSRKCRWHVPRAHYLESWGDARAYDGTVSLVQPLIDPLYEGKTGCELLAMVLGDALTSSYEITKRTFAMLVASSADRGTAGTEEVEALWKQTLHDGVLPGSAWPQRLPLPRSLELPAISPSVVGGYEVVLSEDYSVYDGRFSNNGWLQELPDPITKLSWDNAALISPADAEQIGVQQPGDVIRITHGQSTLDIAAYPLPGHAEGSITIPLGYGRVSAGAIAEGAGVNVNPLLPADGSRRIAGAQVSLARARYQLALSQDNPAIRSEVGDKDAARRVAEELIKVATIGEFLENPNFAKREVPDQQLWQNWSYEDGHKWGMAVDLSACIGCGGCVLACQAENNIPVVGKREMAVGRDMHWIRVDRYFQDERQVASADAHHGAQPGGGSEVSDSSHIKVLHQPMTCHHCETAPCEQVCPVAATMHDKEGLSVMVYSRCIGTRYCNNNCPFKVRRFNWFWNHHGPYHPRSDEELTDIEKMAMNPDVTVRSRGVMEKCSFCSQRINAVKIQAKNERWDRIPDGMITPACAQACPTDAIVFGDLNDAESRVRKLHEDPRSYELLPELNLKSRLLYLAKLTNPADQVSETATESDHTRTSTTDGVDTNA